MNALPSPSLLCVCAAGAGSRPRTSKFKLHAALHAAGVKTPTRRGEEGGGGRG